MSRPRSRPTVAVRGTAERSVPPDSFAVVARVAAQAPQAGDATAALTERFAALEAAIAELPHLRLEVERGPISVYEDAKPLSARRRAWHASREVTLIGRDTGQVAELAGALGRVPDVAIEGPHWRVERDNPVHTDIQAEAVREALARAEGYAAALDGTLGRLVELSDTGMGGMRVMRLAAMSDLSTAGEAGLESLDYTPHPIDITASVEGRWYLNLPD